MHILHINLSDHHWTGGTGIAMHRLHSGLRQAGHQSEIMARVIGDPQTGAQVIPRSRALRIFEGGARKVISPLTGLNDLLGISSFNIKQSEVYQQADVVTFHCLHEDYFSYLALPGLTRDKPAVYVFHDMWFMTGHCAYSRGCERWKTGCGKCPGLEYSPAFRRDTTALHWKLKKRVYERCNLTVVCPSRWALEMAQQSPLLDGFRVEFIPHGVDTELYRPRDREVCRAALGLPEGKKVLFFLSARLQNPVKGYDLLLEAVKNLPPRLKQELVLLTAGEGRLELGDTGIPAVNLGYIEDEARLAQAYNAADLFLFASRAETAGLVALESLSCGTPIVGFRVGGIPDSVRPGLTGYLAEPEKALAFRDGIVELLSDEEGLSRMRQNARQMVVEEYCQELSVRRYIELYQELLSGREGSKAKEEVLPALTSI